MEANAAAGQRAELLSLNSNTERNLQINLDPFTGSWGEEAGCGGESGCCSWKMLLKAASDAAELLLLRPGSGALG